MVLQVKNLSTWLKLDTQWLKAVDDVTFSIDEQETLALIGESGCGKSMIAQSLMRLTPPHAYHGQNSVVELLGTDLLRESEQKMRTIRGKQIAMIFQDPMTSLNPVLTVGHQLLEALTLHQSLKGREAYIEALRLLEKVQISEALRRYEQYPHELSGGMKQRVMIAMALAGKPKLLVADEPTTALDVTTQAQILHLLKTLQQQEKMSILLITHNLRVASEMSHRIAVMYAGHLIETAETDVFLKGPRHPYSEQLLRSLPSLQKQGQRLQTISGMVPSLTEHFTRCRFLSRCQVATDQCHSTPPTWQKVSVGHQSRCHHAKDFTVELGKTQLLPARAPVSVEPLLKVENLKIHFPVRSGLLRQVVGSVKAVDGLSFSIHAGETLAVVGESGCGKTTLAKALLALLEWNGGALSFAGAPVVLRKSSMKKMIRRHCQIIFQDPFSSMNPRMRVESILAEGIKLHKITTTIAERDCLIDSLLEQVGLDSDVKHRFPHEFSGGQRQRICIARALAVQPKLLICDEPTSSLDVSVQAQVLNLLKELQIKQQLAYLFISHDLSVISYLADRIAVMYLGRIVEVGPTSEVLNAPKHPYTQSLIASLPGGHSPPLSVKGELPSPIHPPKGCHFHPRCSQVMARCRYEYPEVVQEGSQTVACHLYKKEEKVEKKAEEEEKVE